MRDFANQETLETNPDAVECGACLLLYVPEKSDGELIVHVARLEGDPPGTPGVAICPDCLDQFKRDGKISRDRVTIH